MRETEKHPNDEMIELYSGMCIIGRIPYGTQTPLEELLKRDYESYDLHPWLIISSTDETVDVVLCSTLEKKAENKHRFFKMMNQDWKTELLKPHPPMEPNVGVNGRRQVVDVSSVMTIPKTALFKDELLEVCNSGGKIMDNDEVKRIRKLTNQYIYETGRDGPLDPWKTEEYDYPLTEYTDKTNDFMARDIKLSQDNHFSI